MAPVQGHLARRALTVTALLALALPGLAACSGGDDGTAADRTPSTTGSTATSSPTPTPTPPGQVLSGLAVQGVTAQFTGTYALDSLDPKQPDATVTIYRLASSYRVDVLRGKATSILLTTTEGLVSCQVQGSQRTCLLLGPVGQPPPQLFDPGLQRLFTTDLAALVRGDGLTVIPAGTLPAAGAIASATCFTVAGTGVDPGEYCLTDTGILRKAQFPSGTLELTKLSGPPDANVFTPPATPTPLPS